MRLTGEVPAFDAFLTSGRLSYARCETTIEDTSVHRLRRVTRRGRLVETEIEALAFIPESYRHGIPETDRKWCGLEMYWMKVIVAKNRKTLAAFMASGELEMEVE